MLKFSKTEQNGENAVYSLNDDGIIKATALVSGNEIIKIEYIDKKTEIAYSAFTVRSLAFLLRDKFETVKVGFYDDNFARIGFEKDGDGMKIKSIYMNFSGCCGGSCNDEN